MGLETRMSPEELAAAQAWSAEKTATGAEARAAAPKVANVGFEGMKFGSAEPEKTDYVAEEVSEADISDDQTELFTDSNTISDNTERIEERIDTEKIPMGDETVSFGKDEEARQLARENYGEKTVKLSESEVARANNEGLQEPGESTQEISPPDAGELTEQYRTDETETLEQVAKKEADRIAAQKENRKAMAEVRAQFAKQAAETGREVWGATKELTDKELKRAEAEGAVAAQNSTMENRMAIRKEIMDRARAKTAEEKVQKVAKKVEGITKKLEKLARPKKEMEARVEQAKEKSLEELNLDWEELADDSELLTASLVEARKISENEKKTQAEREDARKKIPRLEEQLALNSKEMQEIGALRMAQEARDLQDKAALEVGEMVREDLAKERVRARLDAAKARYADAVPPSRERARKTAAEVKAEQTEPDDFAVYEARLKQEQEDEQEEVRRAEAAKKLIRKVKDKTEMDRMNKKEQENRAGREKTAEKVENIKDTLIALSSRKEMEARIEAAKEASVEEIDADLEELKAESRLLTEAIYAAEKKADDGRMVELAKKMVLNNKEREALQELRETKVDKEKVSLDSKYGQEIARDLMQEMQRLTENQNNMSPEQFRSEVDDILDALDDLDIDARIGDRQLAAK